MGTSSSWPRERSAWSSCARWYYVGRQHSDGPAPAQVAMHLVLAPALTPTIGFENLVVQCVSQEPSWLCRGRSPPLSTARSAPNSMTNSYIRLQCRYASAIFLMLVVHLVALAFTLRQCSLRVVRQHHMSMLVPEASPIRRQSRRI